jgi:hypothetical protein
MVVPQEITMLAAILAPEAADALQSYFVKSFVTLVTVYFLPALKKWIVQQAEHARSAAAYNNVSRNGMLAERLKTFLYGSAAMIAERNFPDLAKKIQGGDLKNPQVIKQELYTWGSELKEQAVAYFNQQDIDLLEEFGEQQIEHLIERAANAVSPFPGKDTAEALLQGGAQQILEQGIAVLRQQIPVKKTI